MKGDLPYLKHILDAISRVQSYTKNMGYAKFLDDSKTQSAVVRELEVIGEATKRLSLETRQQYPEIPWEDVSGMRDKLIHAYFDVKLEEVWGTIKKDIPQLKNTVEKAVAELTDMGKK
ncbi:MAG: DUF86 domain-containing protein [Candidatus Hadarchaeota archaeon]